MQEQDADKSDLDIALEYVAAFPDVADSLKDDQFTIFWQYPQEVIASYKKAISFLKTSFGFTDEMVQEHCKEYFGDACDEIVNLKAKEAEIS